MTPNVIDIDSTHQILMAAALLTGSVSLGEQAVMHGLEFLSCDEAPTGAFAEKTIEFALAQTASATDWQERAGADTFFPAELRRVLRLEPGLRRHFVLRMLLGWSPQRCAALLSVDVACVNEANGAAAVELARIAREETIARMVPSNPPIELFPDPRNLYALGAERMCAACA